MTLPDSTQPPASETEADRVLMACLRNVGSCGACAEIIATGMTMATHEGCPVARNAEYLAENIALRQSLTTANADREAMQKAHATELADHKAEVKRIATDYKTLSDLYNEATQVSCDRLSQVEKERDTALAAIESLTAKLKEAEAGWQPIETAPKDGTRILFYDPMSSALIFAGCWDAKFESDFVDDEMIYRGAWTDHGAASFAYEEYTQYQPTHWMPLPAINAAMKGANQ